MPRTSRKFVAVVVWATLCPSFVGVRVLAQAPDPVIAKLQKPISLAAGALSIELGDAVRQLAELSEVSIETDKKAFQMELMFDSIEDQLVQLPRLRNVELDAVLRALLGQVEAVYEIRNDTLAIVPAKGRKWPAIPLTPQHIKHEAEIRRKLDQKITLYKAVVADTPEGVVSVLSERFGVQIVSQLPYPGHKVELGSVSDVTLGTVLERMLDKRSIDVGRFRCTYEIHDNIVIVLLRPVSLSSLLTSQKNTDLERESPTLPPDLERQIQAILAAKGPSTSAYGPGMAKGYRKMFARIGPGGIRQLQAHSNDGVALQAAWEEVALTVPEKEPKQAVRPDSHRLAWFLGIVEGRLHTQVPQWWQEVVLDCGANRRDNIYPGQPKENPYHKAGLDTARCPRDTTLRREAGTIMLRTEKESVAIPENVLGKSDDGRVDSNVSALFTPVRCYLAVHGDWGYGFQLICIDRPSAKVLWKTDVWGTWWAGVEGQSDMWVAVTEQKNRVSVFGASSNGIHVEGFRKEDGTFSDSPADTERKSPAIASSILSA